MKFILRKRKRTVIPLVCLLIYLSIIPMQLSSYVLCIGTDGHVEFEIGRDGRCIDTRDFHEAHTEVVITTVPVGENHCGSCIDLAIFVPLNTESSLVPVQNVLAPIPAFVVAFVRYPTSDATILTYTLLQMPSVADPTLISLRSTILLI